MTPDYDYGIQTSCTLHSLFTFSLCSYYVTDMIKILELRLVAVFVVVSNGEIGNAQWVFLQEKMFIHALLSF